MDFNFQQTFPSGIPIVGGNPILNITQPALISCSQFVGYLAVYRVCIAVASFFFLMMLLMLCVFSSKDPRSYIQNGWAVVFKELHVGQCYRVCLVWHIGHVTIVCSFWCIKWLLVIGLVVAFFFIPDGSNYTFSQGLCHPSPPNLHNLHNTLTLNIFSL